MIVCCRVEPEAGRCAVNSVFHIPLIEWLCAAGRWAVNSVFHIPLIEWLRAAGLNQKQVDELWDCLALDPECSDDCLSWFLNQAKSKDHHALGLETFKHIFLEKVNQCHILKNSSQI